MKTILKKHYEYHITQAELKEKLKLKGNIVSIGLLNREQDVSHDNDNEVWFITTEEK